MKNNNNKSSSSSSYDSSLSPSSSSSSHHNNWLSFSLSNNTNFNSSSNPNLTSSTSDHHHPHPSHLPLFQAFSTTAGPLLIQLRFCFVCFFNLFKNLNELLCVLLHHDQNLTFFGVIELLLIQILALYYKFVASIYLFNFVLFFLVLYLELVKSNLVNPPVYQIQLNIYLFSYRIFHQILSPSK